VLFLALAAAATWLLRRLLPAVACPALRERFMGRHGGHENSARSAVDCSSEPAGKVGPRSTLTSASSAITRCPISAR
jgi:hypothetical protein